MGSASSSSESPTSPNSPNKNLGLLKSNSGYLKKILSE
jgi:hypothetical protein